MPRAMHGLNVKVNVARIADPRMRGGSATQPEPYLGEACIGAAGRTKPGAVHRSRRWGQRCELTSGATPRAAVSNALEALAKSLRRG